ncbi:MAG: hypothetical protein COT73_05875 [Bdellovibrio sp. CG10_big_fil_rev_8_21_14_0_10_47_8]|nr:MAG: hypothetical protein COT73_05875 [Bdellovibrio sp. CG10_big_fil_rev_8_21_14_0_10_47_8]
MFQIVILSFNHPDLTERTVKSALAHVVPSQILLVHNGSSLQNQSKLQDLFPDIQHLIVEENQGFSGGANWGLRRAFQSPNSWVLFLTNDCQLEELGSPPSTPSLSAPLIWARKKTMVDSLGGSFQINRALLAHCKSEDDFYKNAGHAYVPGTAFWIHRDLFEHSGGFDESLGTYWEDVDLSIRLSQQGWHIGLSPETKVLHGIGKTCHKNSHYTTYLFQRNRKRVSLKHAASLGAHRWRIYLALSSSWLRLFWIHARRKNLHKIQLLSRAILDH